jgi:hypothetical protein
MLRRAMTYEGRLELLVAALAGTLLGVVTGIVLGHGSFNIIIWALIGALIVVGVAYWFRVLRGNRQTIRPIVTSSGLTTSRPRNIFEQSMLGF